MGGGEKENMFSIGRKIAALAGAVALIAASVLPVFAQNTGVVTATVTPQLISVSVSPGSVAYGIMALSASDASRTVKLSGTITATNNGNVAENFNIKGSDATGGSTPWTLSDTPPDVGAVGANTYVHDFDNTTGGSFVEAEDKSLNSNTYKALATNVAATSGTANLELQMNMPTSSTDASAQKSTTVTVLAVAFP